MSLIKRCGLEVAMIFALAMLCIFAGVACNSPTSATSAVKATAPVPTGAQQPSSAFLDQWKDFVKLREQIQEIQKKNELQSKIDQLNGMATRLQSLVPQGFRWDEPSLSFVPVIPSVNPTPPPAPTSTPAPAPAKK
jgi:hypothetical protein